ncbi:MAG: DUF4249 domain-containing protein [Ferruginibacter sp.]|nr:DUF4249 domain-containing protein [Cytophagales bacterium]
MVNRGKRNLAWLVTALMASCIEPYQPPVIVADNQYLVVDGYLDNGRGSASVRLSRTQNLTENGPTAESTARVTLEGEGGSRFPLAHQGNGVYAVTGLNVPPGAKYRLRIGTATGKEYLSDLVASKPTPPIDSVTWRAGEGGVQVYVNTHDPLNRTVYYRWEYEETWEFTAAFSSSIEYVNGAIVPRKENVYRCWRTQKSTALSLGTSARLSQDVIRDFPLVFVPFESRKLRIRYSVLVRQFAESREGYDYWQNLKKNTENLGTLFDPQPSQTTGNLRCVSDPSEPVVGYFGASSTEEQRIFIGYDELPFQRYVESCQVDTVKIEDLARFDPGQSLVGEIRGGTRRPVDGYTYSTLGCVDCRTAGTTVRPDFW